jgi:hypothetical protein
MLRLLGRPPAAEFIVGYQSEDGSTELQHRGSVPWHDAPLPPRLHLCRTQTRGVYGYFNFLERCACGAIRMEGFWLEKNARRKDQ